jgi:hypothetical protein
MQQASETGVTIVTKTATAATYGGAGNAIYFGLRADEWSIVGVIGGLAIGFLGLLINAYFKRQHLLIAIKTAKADPDE